MDSLKVKGDYVVLCRGTDVYDRWQEGLGAEQLRVLEAFVTDRIGHRGPAKIIDRDEGSYNIVFRLSFSSGDGDVALRFPKPGHFGPGLADEKTTNEANWMEYIRENTKIPIPRVYSYGADTGLLPPLNLPYILMDWVPGDSSVRDFLKDDPSEDQRLKVYRQVASFYLQLYHLPPFSRLGAITKNETTGQWEVTKRPLTMDMHKVATVTHHVETGHWPTGPLESSADYLEFVRKQHWQQLWDLRNLNSPAENVSRDDEAAAERVPEVARRRYKARRGFALLVSQFCDPAEYDGRQFRFFNPDMDSRNMKFDTQTGEITGVYDFEFANAMPAPFLEDPPLWLATVLPGVCLDMGFFPWFRQIKYKPRLDEFLNVMREQEEELGTGSSGQPRLSGLMQKSWDTDRVWFNFAATHSDHVDAVYWEVLCKHHPNGTVPELPEAQQEEMERYVLHTKDQIVAYKKAWDEYNEERRQ